MGGKRFEYNHEQGYKDYIYDIDDNRMMWELDCICELLNTFHEENEQLKQKYQNREEYLHCILQKFAVKYKRDSDEFKLLFNLAKELGVPVVILIADDDGDVE